MFKRLFLMVSLASCQTQKANTDSGLRIVGGQTVASTDPVRSVTLAVIAAESEQTHCSAALVGANLALTSAHCPIKVGDTLAFGNGLAPSPSIVRTISAISIHPCYATNKRDFDVALVKFDGGIPAGFGPPAAILSAQTTLSPGTPMVVAGFGTFDSATREVDGMLRKVTLKISQEPSFSPKVLSLKADQPGHAACFGDSGGPVFSSTTKGAVVLAGIEYAIVKSASGPCNEFTYAVDLRSHGDWLARAMASLRAGVAPDAQCQQ